MCICVYKKLLCLSVWLSAWIWILNKMVYIYINIINNSLYEY